MGGAKYGVVGGNKGREMQPRYRVTKAAHSENRELSIEMLAYMSYMSSKMSS